MAEPKVHDLVVSLAGHDRGKLYIVTGAADGRFLVCDGKGRPMADPKSKNPKHVRTVTGAEMPASDKEIRQTLALAVQTASAKEERLLAKR